MKFATLIAFLFFAEVNAQINNLNDLLEISALNLEKTISVLQYTWELNSPIQDTSEKGFITERYIFSYNRNNKKQILNKCGRMDLSTSQTLWLTNFVSNDTNLLNSMIKNLTYQGFERKGKLNSNSMYEDGNRIVTIQTESDNEYKLPKGCYSIIVVVNKKINGRYFSNNKSEKIIQPKNSIALKTTSNANDALSNILNRSISEKGSNQSSFKDRKKISNPVPKYTCNEMGKIVVEVTVDREGNVIRATPGIKGTTNTAKCLLDASKEAALGTKWEADENAPDNQIGQIVYNFNLN